MKIKKIIFEAFGAKAKGMRMQSAVLGVGAAPNKAGRGAFHAPLAGLYPFAARLI